MSTVALLRRGWRVFVPVVVVNAAVQAAATAPFLTPSASGAFLVLVLVSALSFAAALAFVGAGAAGRVLPTRRLWIASILAVVLLAGCAVVAAPLVVVAAIVVLALLPAATAGRTLREDARYRAAHPFRTIARVVVTVVVLVLLWIGAFASGLFVTGPLSAAITWLGIGAVGVVLLCDWSARPRTAG